MAGNESRPEHFDNESDQDEFNVSELVSEDAGAHSPFGNLEFPLPVDQLQYRHPSATDLPNFAEGH